MYNKKLKLQHKYLIHNKSFKFIVSNKIHD